VLYGCLSVALVLQLNGQVNAGSASGRSSLASVRADAVGLTFAGPTIILPTGALALSDLPSKSVLVIDTLAHLVSKLGGEGRAPGMLLSIHAMGAFGDSVLWATDGNSQRVTRWSLRSFRYVSSASLDGYTAAGDEKTAWAVYSLDPTGSAVLAEYKPPLSGAKARTSGRLPLRASNGATTPLGSFSWGPWTLSLAGGRTVSSFQPFSDNPVYGRSADGRRIVAIRRLVGPERDVAILWYNGRT
jgi:hypothetical protein